MYRGTIVRNLSSQQQPEFTVNTEAYSGNNIKFDSKFAETFIIKSVMLAVLLQFCCVVG